MAAKKEACHPVRVCVCVCGSESDARKRYSLITEQMGNMSAFDLFVFGSSRAGVKRMKLNRNESFIRAFLHVTPPTPNPRWPLFHNTPKYVSRGFAGVEEKIKNSLIFRFTPF